MTVAEELATIAQMPGREMKGSQRLVFAAVAAFLLVPSMPALADTSWRDPKSTKACSVSGTHERALAALRSCDEGELQMLFRSLSSGPMPKWGSQARGYWRFYPDAGSLMRPLDAAVNHSLWQGKTFFTRRDGGFLVNRVSGDRPGFPAVVEYGPARLDGRQAIIVDYEKTGDPLALFFRDEIRRVRRGLYLGFGWWNHEPSGWTGPDHITFILDFVHPEIPRQGCAACLPSPDA